MNIFRRIIEDLIVPGIILLMKKFGVDKIPLIRTLIRKLIRYYENRKYNLLVEGKPLIKVSDAFYPDIDNLNERVKNGGKIDVMIYQLGLRSKLPIMDCFYHVYLKELLEKKIISRVLVFATIDLTDPEMEKVIGNSFDISYKEYQKRTLALYGELSTCVSFADTNQSKTKPIEFISKEFNSAVDYIWSSKFQQFINNSSSSDAKHFDIKKENPNDWTGEFRKGINFPGVVHHINRTWFIAKEIDEHISRMENQNISIGTIYWFKNIAKIGVMHAYFKDKGNVKHTHIYGKSIEFKNKNKAIPTHDYNKTICLYESIDSLCKKFREQSSLGSSYIDAYIELLKVIIDSLNEETKDEKKFIAEAKTIIAEYSSLPQCPLDVNFDELCDRTKKAIGMMVHFQRTLKVSMDDLNIDKASIKESS